MALPIAPIIGAGASILGQVLQNASNAKQNAASRQFSIDMFNRERHAALADWDMQNEYNSPAAQMKRYRDAGLNENLIYGQGVSTAAGVPRGSSAPAAQFTPNHYDLSGVGSSLASIYDLKLKEATTNNLEAQNTVTLQDALLKAAQTANVNANTAKTGMDTDAGRFALTQSQRLADTSAEMAQAQLRKTITETDIALSSNERAIAQNAASLATAAEAILKSRSDRATAVGQRRQIDAQIESIRRDVRLKDLDIQLKRFGIQPSDPLWQRVLGRILGNDNFDKGVNSVMEKLDKPLQGTMNWLNNLGFGTAGGRSPIDAARSRRKK